MPTINATNKKLLGLMTENVDEYSDLLLTYKDQLTQEYISSATAINQQMADLWAKVGLAEPNLVDWNKYNRLDEMLDGINKELVSLGGKELNINNVGIKNAFQQGYYKSAYAYESAYGASMSFATLNKDAIQASLLNPLNKIKWQDSISTNMKVLNRQIRTDITQGILLGKSYVETSKDVFQRMVNIGANGNILGAVTKSYLIVSTETHRVLNLGAHQAFMRARTSAQQLKLPTPLKFWISTLDLRTRDSHRGADGTEADGNGIFRLFGVEFVSPGNTGLAKEDILCRCSFGTKVDGLENKTRKDNLNKKQIKNVNYCTWYKNKFGSVARGCGAPKLDKLPKKKVKVPKTKANPKGVKTVHTSKRPMLNPANSPEKTHGYKNLTEKQFNDNYNKYHNEMMYSSENLRVKEVYTQHRLEGGALNKKEIDTVMSYTHQGYANINEKLYKGLSLTKMELAFTENLNHALTKLPNFNGSVIRTTWKSTLDVSKFKVGNTIQWNSFTSSGKIDSTFFKYANTSTSHVSFHIKSKTGKYIQDFSFYKREKEVLFGTDTKFQVEKVTNINNKTDIYMTEVL